MNDEKPIIHAKKQRRRPPAFLSALLATVLALFVASPFASGATTGLSAVISGGLYAASGSSAGFESAANFTKLGLYPAVSGLTTGQCIRATGAATMAFGALDLANANAVTGVVQLAQLQRPSTMLRVLEDWPSGTLVGSYGCTAIASGTGAASTLVGTGSSATHIGIVQLSSGTQTTGRASIIFTTGTDGVGLRFPFTSVSAISAEWLIQVPTLDDGIDTFNVRLGLADTTNAGDMVNGIYFEYDKAQDTHWRVCSASASTRTKQNTTITVTAGQWYRLRTYKAEGSTTWNFEIDGVDTALPVSTNIPSAYVQAMAKIEKTAGTNARTALLDWLLYEQTWSTPRAP